MPKLEVSFVFYTLNYIREGGGAQWHLKLNSEQNGLNIELDSCYLVHKPIPIGTTSKWQKTKIFICRLG